MGDRARAKWAKKWRDCCAPISGKEGGSELAPHLTQCGLGWGLPLYQVASWSIQPFGRNRHGPKIGGCGAFGGRWVPIYENVAWTETYIHTKWYTNPSKRLAKIHQRHRHTWQTDKWSDSIGQTVLRRSPKKSWKICTKFGEEVDYGSWKNLPNVGMYTLGLTHLPFASNNTVPILMWHGRGMHSLECPVTCSLGARCATLSCWHWAWALLWHENYARRRRRRGVDGHVSIESKCCETTM